ncbi:hypothetical protein JOM56_003878 [Amanita muscaria]
MSSRPDYRKRERSRERDDKERDADRAKERDRHHRSGRGREDGRRRSSRSRSPPRSNRRDYERRDYRRERDDDRRERAEREHKKRDDRDHDREREYKRDRGERKTTVRREDEKAPPRQDEPPVPKNSLAKFFESVEPPVTSDKQGNEAKDETIVEEGEEMDAVNDDDAGMMAAMGMGGFGSTKGKHVAGNQEGGVDIKKIRTWRQYMNRYALFCFTNAQQCFLLIFAGVAVSTGMVTEIAK